MRTPVFILLTLCAGPAGCGSLGGVQFEPPPGDLAGEWQLDAAGSSDSVALAVVFADTLRRRSTMLDAGSDTSAVPARGRPQFRRPSEIASLVAAAKAPARFVVEQTDSLVVFRVADQPPLVLHVGGSPVEGAWLDGVVCGLRARWRGARLEIERSFDDGTRLTEYYGRIQGTSRLAVYVRVDDFDLAFRRVYDTVSVDR